MKGNILTRLFRGLCGPAQVHEPLVHDFSTRGWGHDYTITQIHEAGQRIELCGWCSGLRRGDHLILPNKRGTTRYRVLEVRYFADPPDMFSATLAFHPRSPGAVSLQ